MQEIKMFLGHGKGRCAGAEYAGAEYVGAE